MCLPMNFIKKQTLKDGHELIIRKPIEDDALKMIKYLNIIGGESDNLLFGENEFHLSIEQEREYIKSLENNNHTFMILGLIDNIIVSIAQISSSNRKRVDHNCNLGISVKKEYWQKGIASTMLKELIKHAKILNKKTISLGVKASNKNAIKLYEKFGFEKVGVHKNYFNINGHYDDEILMDLFI